MIAIVALILAAAVLLGVLFLSDLERELGRRLDEEKEAAGETGEDVPATERAEASG